MPVSTDIRVKQNEGGSYEPLPADVYQVQIVDIEEIDGEYQGVPRKQFKFMCQVAAPVKDPDCGKSIYVWTSQAWNKGGGKYKASNLYLLYSAVMKFYQPELDVTKKDEYTGEEINELIGKQVRVSAELRTKDDGKQFNKVTSYLPIKSEVEYEPVIKTNSQDNFEKEVFGEQS